MLGGLHSVCLREAFALCFQSQFLASGLAFPCSQLKLGDERHHWKFGEQYFSLQTPGMYLELVERIPMKHLFVRTCQFL